MNPEVERVTGQMGTNRRVGRALPLAFAAFTMALSSMFLAAPESGAAAKGPKGDVSFEGARDYIVLYKKSADLDVRLETEARKGNGIEDRFESTVNGALLELEAEDVNRLRKDDRVLAIEPDRPVSIVSRTQGTRSSASWGLDRIDQRNLPLNGTISTPLDGLGVENYVLDTGIRLDHTEFTGRVNPEGFSAFSGGWNDCQGHGTHVAGTIAGSTFGVAPASTLTAIRVLDCEGSGSWSSVIAGIDWMITDHGAGQPAVANMSLGGGRSDTINAAVQRAVDDGVTMVVAAGNEATDACSRSPASAPNAVTVGSTTNADQVSSFSNHGRCVDIFAPGSSITSAWHTSPSANNTISGTSMAAPHVAGVASLILSGQSSLNPAAVTDRLVASSTPDRLSGLTTCTRNLLAYAGSGPDLTIPPGTSAGPPNDNFANAQTLSGLGGVNGTSACATRETGEPSHGFGSSASIWYRWTAGANGTVTFRTEGSNYDTLLAGYSGSSLGSLNQLAQNDDAGGGVWSQVSFRVAPGTTYSIAIDGWGGAAGSTVLSGSFTPDSGTEPPAPGPGDPPGDVGSGEVRDLGQVSGSDRQFEFGVSVTANSNICVGGYCSWHPVTFVYPEDRVCSANGVGGTGAWLGSLSSSPETQSAERVVEIDHDAPFRFCTYLYSYGYMRHFLVHEAVLVPDGRGQQPGEPGDPEDPGDPGDPSDPGDPGEPEDPLPAALPKPRIDSGPARKTRSRSARFIFSGRGDTTFQCRFGGRRYWAECGSPMRYRGLKPGRHVLRVRQTDGQTKSAAATYPWRIVGKKR